MRAGKVLAAVFGAILALAAIGLVVGGGALVWAYGTQRDADGFLNSPSYQLDTTSHALVTGDIDLQAEPGEWWPDDLATVRIEAESTIPIFVGIGPATQVDAFLSGVGYDEIEITGPGAEDVHLTSREGGAPAMAPGEQGFWVTSSEGSGTQSFAWDIEPGEWIAVIMNADGSAGVDATVEAGVEIGGVLLAVGLGLLIAGLLLGGIAAGLLVLATRPAPSAEIPAALAGRPLSPAPVAIEGTIDPNLTRWMWLVKWFLAIPHYIVLAFLWTAFVILTIVAFFAILFTGRYPKGIFDFNVGVMRWTWRVQFYTNGALATDRYPPFTLADADYPAKLEIAYPGELSRGLALVKWWLLAIPHYLIVGLFTSGLVWWTTDIGNGDAVLETGGGLISLITLIAAFALLFTGRYPQGLFDLVMGLNRWVYRVGAYVALMTDEYPPFRLDLGGSEPQPEPAGPGGGGDRGGTTAREPQITST